MAKKLSDIASSFIVDNLLKRNISFEDFSLAIRYSKVEVSPAALQTIFEAYSSQTLQSRAIEKICQLQRNSADLNFIEKFCSDLPEPLRILVEWHFEKKIELEFEALDQSELP
jgi:hypothetical protein